MRTDLVTNLLPVTKFYLEKFLTPSARSLASTVTYPLPLFPGNQPGCDRADPARVGPEESGPSREVGPGALAGTWAGLRATRCPLASEAEGHQKGQNHSMPRVCPVGTGQAAATLPL